MKTCILAGCVALATAGLGAGLDTRPVSSDDGLPQPGFGMASAWVYHAVTSEPLAGVPVVVRQLDGPETPSRTTFTSITDGSGRAVLGPLPTGQYEALVVVGPKRSDPAFFNISGKSGPTTVTLFFNPDID